MTDLHYLPATEALQAFHTRELSPAELNTGDRPRRGRQPVIARSPNLLDRALKQARAAEARYAGLGGPPRPLEGLPVAVKEEAEIAGQHHTLGSLPLREYVAKRPAPSCSGSSTRAASCTPAQTSDKGSRTRPL
jgi:Asp-tRNA(Asn)/Glu-tRNA(Gln) amidotransferase A subunit family amidase